MIDNERRERQSSACRALAQLTTQRGKGHRINATTDGEALIYGQLVCFSFPGDGVFNSHRTNVPPRELAKPLLWEISFQQISS